MEIVSLLLELISTTYSQSWCDERKGKWGNIIYHILLWGGEGGGGEGGKNWGTIVLPLPIDSCGQSKIKDRLPPSE